MELLGVRLEIPANAPVVLLREHGGDKRVLPIYIGPEEAKAIAMALEGVVPPRPLTHDLLRDVVQALGAELRKVTVTELRDRTFYAELDLVVGERSIVVSARPSDAIALAVRVDAPLYASEEVLADAGTPSSEGEEEEAEEIVDQFREFIDQVNPEDFAS